MPRCSFCKQNYEFPRGLTLILNDGNILYFCSSKCRKNQLKLKRDNKKVNWIRKAGVSLTSETAVHPSIIQRPAEAPKTAEEKPAEKKAEPAKT